MFVWVVLDEINNPQIMLFRSEDRLVSGFRNPDPGGLKLPPHQGLRGWLHLKALLATYLKSFLREWLVPATSNH